MNAIQQQNIAITNQRNAIELQNSQITQQRDSITGALYEQKIAHAKYIVEVMARERDSMYALDGLLAVLPHDYTNPDKPYTAEAGTALMNWLNKNRLDQIITQNKHEITSDYFSPDGKKLVTIMDNKAYVWDMETYQMLFLLNKHTGSIDDIRFGPDGKQIITYAKDTTIRVWNAETGHEDFVIDEHKNYVTTWESDVFSPNGKCIATHGGDGMLYLWEAKTGQKIFSFNAREYTQRWYQTAQIDRNIHVQFNTECDAWINGVYFSQDGKKIIIMWRDFKIHLCVWDIDKKCEIFRLEEYWDGNFYTDVDGKIIFYSHEQNDKTDVWDVGTGKKDIAFNNDEILQCSSSLNNLLIRASNQAFIWNIETGNKIVVNSKHNHEIQKSLFSPDENKLITSDGETTYIQDITTGITQKLSANLLGANDIMFTPDSKKIIITTNDKVYLTNINTREETLLLEDSSEYRRMDELIWEKEYDDNDNNEWQLDYHHWSCDDFTTQFSPDSTKLLIMDCANTIHVWDIKEEKKIFTIDRHYAPPASIVFSPDSKKIITVAPTKDSTVYIWNIDLPIALDSVNYHIPYDNSSNNACSNTDKIIVESDSMIYVKDIITDRILLAIGKDNTNMEAKLSPNGRKIITFAYNKASIWDIQTKKKLLELETQSSNYYFGYTAFSVDGTKIVTSEYCQDRKDERIVIWDAETGVQLFILDYTPCKNSSALVSINFGSNDNEILILRENYNRDEAQNKTYIWRVDYEIQNMIDRGHMILDNYNLIPQYYRKSKHYD